jgi:hypothetical protein
MLDLKCPKCGMILPPENTKCPGCDFKYGTEKTERAPARSDFKLGRTGFNLNCPAHGHVHITARVSAPPTRCPFC